MNDGQDLSWLQESAIGRGDFLQQLLAALGVAQMGTLGLPASLGAQTPASAPRGSPVPLNIPAPPDNLVGIQMGPHTMLDEGIEHVMDLVQKTAAVDTLFTYSHSYGGDLHKPISWLAKDHGKPPIDQRTRKLGDVWVKEHDQYYKDTSLRHPKMDSSYAYHDRDLFAEMMKPLRARGMKIYPRILEDGPKNIVNFDKVVTVDVDGKPTKTGCWNHPEYRAFWNATVTNLFRSYDVDGFQWGAERASPLINVIQNGRRSSAGCFCKYCLARGKAHAIDATRAREGFSQIANYVAGMRSGELKPADGAAAAFLRIIIRYPEVLAWEYQYRLAREETMKGMYDTIKTIKPAAPVGWHVDHWATTMDIVARAAMSYAEMAPWSDYLKVVVYHAVTGPRTRSWVRNVQRSVLNQLTLQEALDLHYELFGYDKNLEAKAAELAKGGTPDYVYRETKRSVASAEGKTKIYPGLGFDLPPAGTPPNAPTDDPDTIYMATKKAYEAGASGIVLSREYEEMLVPHLEAVGRAVRELGKTAKPG